MFDPPYGRIKRSINPQVRFSFPGVDGAAVAFVFGDLGVAECVVDVVTECGADDDVFLEFDERLA